MACWADDVNGDGYPDLIVVGFPGAPCYWYENPKGGSGLSDRTRNLAFGLHETPLSCRPVRHRQRRVLVMGWQPKGKKVDRQRRIDVVVCTGQRPDAVMGAAPDQR